MAKTLNKESWSPAQLHTDKAGATDLNAIFKALYEKGLRFVDDHNGSIVKPGDRCTGFCLFIMGNGYVSVTPRWSRDYFSVNPLYVGDDGYAHLDTCSVGGTVMGSIDQFNKDYSDENLESTGHTWIIPQKLTPINL